MAVVPCPGHDRVFAVQFGKTFMTSGPKGCASAPRIYECDPRGVRIDVTAEARLEVRGEVIADVKPVPPALRAEPGKIVDVSGVVERDGQYYIHGSAAQGNFRIVGL